MKLFGQQIAIRTGVMYCREILLLLTLAPCCVAQSANVAPDPAVAPQPLTLSEAIARAEANSPRLRATAASEGRARALLTTARAYSNPILEVYEGRQYARPIATPGVPGLLQHYGALQPIEIPSERAARRDVAVAGQRSARAESAGIALSVVADAKHAFYRTLQSREEIGHAQENLQLVEDLRRRVQVEVNVGEKGRLELSRAEAELAQAQFAVRSAQINYSNSVAVLRAAIAAAPDEQLAPEGTLETVGPLPPLAIARGQMLQSHPAIAQTEAEIDRSQAALRDQKALRIPQPTIFAEYENQPDLRFWRTGITIPLPLFDRRRGQIEDARATIEGNTAMLQQRRLELTSALERAYEQYQVADQQVQSLEAGELHAAEQAVAGAQAAYRFGERGIVEVLDAQRVLQSIRGDLLDAQFARQSALVDLEELGVKP